MCIVCVVAVLRVPVCLQLAKWLALAPMAGVDYATRVPAAAVGVCSERIVAGEGVTAPPPPSAAAAAARAPTTTLGARLAGLRARALDQAAEEGTAAEEATPEQRRADVSAALRARFLAHEDERAAASAAAAATTAAATESNPITALCLEVLSVGSVPIESRSPLLPVSLFCCCHHAVVDCRSPSLPVSLFCCCHQTTLTTCVSTTTQKRIRPVVGHAPLSQGAPARARSVRRARGGLRRARRARVRAVWRRRRSDGRPPLLRSFARRGAAAVAGARAAAARRHGGARLHAAHAQRRRWGSPGGE